MQAVELTGVLEGWQLRAVLRPHGSSHNRIEAERDSGVHEAEVLKMLLSRPIAESIESIQHQEMLDQVRTYAQPKFNRHCSIKVIRWVLPDGRQYR